MKLVGGKTNIYVNRAKKYTESSKSQLKRLVLKYVALLNSLFNNPLPHPSWCDTSCYVLGVCVLFLFVAILVMLRDFLSVKPVCLRVSVFHLDALFLFPFLATCMRIVSSSSCLFSSLIIQISFKAYISK